ncbi:MAG: RluA family pseudouridine synthase [Cyclobacteriaceae bacterium]
MTFPLPVLYEDNHLIAINKRAGQLVQGDETGDTPLSELVKGYIREKFKKPGEAFLGVIHRLDRPVSGVVLFARTSKGLERMNEQFRLKQTQKTYWAIVAQAPAKPEDRLVHWLEKNEAKNKTTAYRKERDGAQRSELSYRYIKKTPHGHWLEVKPVTGRPHQIRVQLADIGCPIVGDLKYGAVSANEDASICLHARALEFIHPVTKVPVVITADLPSVAAWSAVGDPS